MDSARTSLLGIALLLAPWAGVGVLNAFFSVQLGTGIQPAFVPLFALVVLSLPAMLRSLMENEGRWLLFALAWTLASTTSLWLLHDVGLLGESPWSKGLKQFVLLAFFAISAWAVRTSILEGDQVRRRFLSLERYASAGLLLGCCIALVQAVAFHFPTPFFDRIDAFVASNPSIAAGSGELYLGHSFVGIPRLRGPMPEPLLFGSYLVVVLPITLGGAFRGRGFARTWRLLALGLGTLCLVGTFSRGAWLGAMVMVIVVMVGLGRNLLRGPSRSALLLTAVGGVVGLVLALWQVTGMAPWQLPQLMFERLTQTAASHDMSNLTRWWSWRVAWDLFLESPVGGIGWGGFGFFYFGQAGSGSDAAHFGWPVTNSLPLLLLAETGLLGLLLWGRVFWPAVKSVVGKQPGPAQYLLGAAFCGVLAQSLTFSQWNLPHLWLLIGVSWASIRLDAPEMVRKLRPAPEVGRDAGLDGGISSRDESPKDYS